MKQVSVTTRDGEVHAYRSLRDNDDTSNTNNKWHNMLKQIIVYHHQNKVHECYIKTHITGGVTILIMKFM